MCSMNWVLAHIKQTHFFFRGLMQNVSTDSFTIWSWDVRQNMCLYLPLSTQANLPIYVSVTLVILFCVLNFINISTAPHVVANTSPVASNGTNNTPNCGMGTGGPAPAVNGTASVQTAGPGAQDAPTQRGQSTGAEEPLPTGQVL